MPVVTSESVLTELRQLSLLTPEQLTRVEAAAGKAAPGPEKLLARLSQRGWLTPFQAESLLTGRGAGLVFGHYLLLARLGEGGMGAVYKARHRRLGRIDAVKVIRADKIASKLVAKRFLREIQLTADLNHPHIIKALDAGQFDRQLYLATEYIPGEDLTATVRRDGPFSVADACMVAYQTALALRHLHERNLVHRDLKPSNIMREAATRTVKLLDLGLSGSLQDHPGMGWEPGALTRDGVMLGTPDFMAPEQARNPHGVDIRADLYALGCTFFYLLTGRTPYEGSAVEKLLQHASAAPPPIVMPRGATPPALQAIIHHLMAKEPEDRFQTPQEVLDALLALRPGYSATTPSTLPALPTVEESDSTVGDWQSQFELLVARDASSSHAALPTANPGAARGFPRRLLLSVLVLVGAGVGAYSLTRPRTLPEQPRATPPPAPVEDDPTEELKSLRKAISNAGENRDQIRTRVVLFRSRFAGTPFASSAASLLRRLPSPLDRLAVEKDPEADVLAVRLGEARGEVTALAFSPTDDRLLVARRGNAPEEWALPAARETGRLRNLTVAEETSPSVSADAKTVVAVDRDGNLSVWSDGRQRTVAVATGLAVAVAAVAPDGKTAVVAFATPEEKLARVDLDSGKVLARLDSPSGAVNALAISPDGTSCFATGDAAPLRVFPLSGGKPTQTFTRTGGLTIDPTGAFAPDGQRLYLIGASRAAGRFGPGSTTPDVTYEVAQEAADPESPRGGKGQPGQAKCIAVSADEASVAVGTRAGSVYIYSASTGKVSQEYRFNNAVRAVAFSTHGRAIALALEAGSVLLVPIK